MKIRMKKRTAVALALAAMFVSPAFPQAEWHSSKQYEIEFTRVADTTNAFRGFGDFPAINNRGEVAFIAIRNGVAGVFRVREDAERLTTVASVADGISSFGDDVAVNAGGVVAFGASTAANSRAIFKGDGTALTLIADSLVNGLFKLGVGAPSINAAGTVAFASPLGPRASSAAVFTGRGGPLTTVISTSTGGFGSFGSAAINDSGTIAFSAGLADGSRGIFAVSGVLVDIIDTNHHLEIESFNEPVINNAGVVAGVAFVFPSLAVQVFTGTARGIVPRNDPANPEFRGSEHPSINNHGAVAFSAIEPFPGAGGPTGIFLETSGGKSLIPVVRPGDKMFGSRVDHVNLGRFALNDRFQMAFSYTLTDGRSGIAVASFDGEKGGDDRSR